MPHLKLTFLFIIFQASVISLTGAYIREMRISNLHTKRSFSSWRRCMLVRIIQRRHRSFFETGKTKLYYITNKLYKIELISAFITATIFCRRVFLKRTFQKENDGSHILCSAHKILPPKSHKMLFIKFYYGLLHLTKVKPSNISTATIF